MANEIRVRANFVAGQLSSGMLTGDTLMQGAGLADLPAIGSTEYAPIAIFRTDNAGRVIQKEIVYVTAHTAGATSATVTRGREGTTAQAWNAGDRFSHTDTALDNLIVCTSSTRPSTPFEGLEIYERDTKVKRLWDGAAWVRSDAFDTGWTQPPLLNGWVNYGGVYSVAKYRRIGELVVISGLVKSGSGPIFVLPAGFRPTGNLHFPAMNSTGGAAQIGVLEIRGTASGFNDVYHNMGGNYWFSIECTFVRDS